MSSYSAEQEEQLARYKDFWGKYGNAILWVLIICFSSIAAYNGWRWYEARQATQAVVHYEKLENILQDWAEQHRNAASLTPEQLKAKGELLAQAAAVQNVLTDEYARSPYAERGALLLAQAAHQAAVAELQSNAASEPRTSGKHNANIELAKTQLRWASEHARLEEYQFTARLLLSGLLMDAGQLDEVETLLAKPMNHFEGLRLDRLGDLFVLKKDHAKARSQYEAALKALPNDNPWRAVVERKLNLLP